MADRPSNSSAASTFLSSLPTVKRDDLPEDSQTCHICQEPYFSDNNHQHRNPQTIDGNGPASADVPKKLPCNHILGSVCLATWFKTNTNNNTCPMCRAVLFDRGTSNRGADLFSLIAQGIDSNPANVSSRVSDADLAFLDALLAPYSAVTARPDEAQTAPPSEESEAVIWRIGEGLERVYDQLDGVEGRTGELERLLREFGT